MAALELSWCCWAFNVRFWLCNWFSWAAAADSWWCWERRPDKGKPITNTPTANRAARARGARCRLRRGSSSPRVRGAFSDGVGAVGAGAGGRRVDVGALRRFGGAGPTPDLAPGLPLVRFGPVRAPSARRGRNRGRAGRDFGGAAEGPGADRAGVPVGLAAVDFGAGVPVGFPVPVGFAGGPSDATIGFAAPTSDPVGLPTRASDPLVSGRVTVGGKLNERAGRVSGTRGALSLARRRGRSGRVALARGVPVVPVGLAAVPLLSPLAAVNSRGGALLEWA